MKELILTLSIALRKCPGGLQTMVVKKDVLWLCSLAVYIILSQIFLDEASGQEGPKNQGGSSLEQ